MSTFFVSKSRLMAAGEWTAEADPPDVGLAPPAAPKRPQRRVTLHDLNADLDPGLWRTILKGLDAVPVAGDQTRPLAARDGPITPRGPDAAPLPPSLQAPESVAASRKPSDPQCSSDRPRPKASPGVIDRSASGRTQLSSVSEPPKILEDVMEGASGIAGYAKRACSFLPRPFHRPLRGVLSFQALFHHCARPPLPPFAPIFFSTPLILPSDTPLPSGPPSPATATPTCGFRRASGGSSSPPLSLWFPFG